jgi:hypothetical protein
VALIGKQHDGLRKPHLQFAPWPEWACRQDRGKRGSQRGKS